jgi:hypothetical protein
MTVPMRDWLILRGRLRAFAPIAFQSWKLVTQL